MKEKQKKNKGITLIALAITIIVLLILAGVTMATLTGDNGLLTKAGEAKQVNKEAEVKEKIILAANAAKTNNLGKLTKELLDEELTKEFGANNYEIILVGKGFIIIVNNLEYNLRSDGTINKADLETNNIENAGDLSKGGQYDGLTEETAYRVACIEDLVEWSKNFNNYKNKCIKLEKTIDFENTSDYNDYKKITTDINENGINETLITELTTGKGFKPIATFSGIFDGQNNEIQNLYEDVTTDAALILRTDKDSIVTIKNLGITGSIKGNSHVAGIMAYPYGENSSLDIIDCYNTCKVNGNGQAGGIIGYSDGSYQSKIRVIDSHNEGKISGACAGGIIGGGHAYEFRVYNAYNEGNISGTSAAGGIIGGNDDTCLLTVYNSFNKKTIYGNITGGIGGKCIISPYNVFNSGNINSLNQKPAGIVGSVYRRAINLDTSYYLDNVNVAANVQFNRTQIGSGRYTKEQMQSQDFVDTLNSYVNTYNEEHKNEEGFIKLSRWKYNEGEYPTFE